MAGIIVLRDGDWYASGGAFRAVAHGVIDHLRESSARAAIVSALSLAVESELYFLDIAGDFSSEMSIEFALGLDSYLRHVAEVGRQDHPDPERYEDFVHSVTRLRDMLNASMQ